MFLRIFSCAVIDYNFKSTAKFCKFFLPSQNIMQKVFPLVKVEIVYRKDYSHLSNEREVTLTDFEKFHPPQKKSPLHVYWFH
jgi:hypothetical protein